MVRTKFLLFAAAAAWILVSNGAARAQGVGPGPNDPAAPGDSVPADAHLPEPLQTLKPEYPPDAAAARLEATVRLRVSIDAEGNITEAEVIEPAGHGFDEAARAAVLRARYRPARRGGTNVESRVLVRVEFRLPQAPPTGSLAGHVLLPGSGARRAAGVEVAVRTSGGATHI